MQLGPKFLTLVLGHKTANYSQLEQRVEKAYNLLTIAKRSNLANPSVLASEQEAQANKSWYKLAGAEGSFLKQRSQIQWTILGDANTAFYHRAIKTIYLCLRTYLALFWRTSMRLKIM